MGFLSNNNQGIKKYTILQRIEITEYPGNQKYVKVLFSKVEDSETQQANNQSNIKKKELAKKNAIIEAKEKAEQQAKDLIISEIKEEKKVLF